MRKFVTVILCALLSIAQVWAQNRTITGKVTDQKTGQALFGVTVTASGTNALTDESGNYRISVAASAKSITFMFVGYDRFELPIRGNVVNASLNPDTKSLEEVVVTGYSREKKTQFAGAASVISAKAVETVPVGSFDQALQGRAPGMLVNSGSGQPGTSPTIRIRGVQSIQGAGAQPLYIIDGVPTNESDFATLNPNDFESLTVLKDANAAALYGARGGTGVIVITTKRGKAGTTNFQYRTQVGFTQRPNFERLNLMNTREMLAYEERARITGTPGWTYSAQNTVNLGGISDAREKQILDSIAAIDIDYAEIMYRQGLSQSHELNMSGGNEKTRFYLSGSYFDQEGIDLGSSLKRYTTRFNVDHTSNKLTVGLNTSVGYSIGKFSEGEQLGNSPLNPFQMTYRAKTYENPFNPDGSLRFGANTSLNLRQVANLLERIQNAQLTRKQIKINAGLNLTYKILPTLTFKNVFGIDVSSDQSSRFINPNSYVGSLQQFQSGLAQEGQRTISQFINTTSLVYSRRFASIHEVEAGAYFEAVRGYNKTLGFTLFNLDPRLTETGQGAGPLPVGVGQTTYPQNASSAKSQFGIRSFFGTLRYTYDNKYTVTGNIRRDGTSRIISPENREITTWSAGIIWNALQEKFLADQKILTDLKVRASYGIVPNIGSIPTAGYGNGVSFGGITNYQGPQQPVFGTTTYAGSTITGQAPTSPGNPNLRIENIRKWNFGLEFAVWKNRARFTVDYYRNRTVDLFVNQPLSATTGFGTLAINAGVMSNKGFEFTANIDVIKQKDLNINISANHSINNNTIEDLGLVNEYLLGTFLIKKGLPYGAHFTYNYLGVNPADGRPIYETLDGKTTNSLANAGQFAKFGTFLPKHQGGLNLEIRYRAITVAALFSYQFDVVRYNNIRSWITRGIPGYQAAVRGSRELLTEQWLQPGDVKTIQASTFDRGFTSADLEDAKFLRFRNLNVSYQIPTIKLGNGNNLIKGARFYVQAQNLAVWSPWRGLDPEDDNNISLNEYPNPKMFVVGLDINF
ncbi:MAG: SusC/RagA family TonB-linked outer membrane protein [Sediminibacterium sp.]